MMIGVRTPRLRKVRQTSRPFILGSMTSNRIRSGCSAKALSRPSTPSSATTTWNPSNSQLSRSATIMSRSSSMMRSFGKTFSGESPLRLLVIRSRTGGQENRESATAARPAVEIDSAMMCLHNTLGQTQTKAAAFGLLNQAVVYPVEFVKHSALLRIGNADSFVGYFDSDLILGPVHSHSDFLGLGGVLQRIVDQVRYGLRNRLTVHKREW